ncbi:hypothetical protein JL721_11709 [Aureococcus anophagefferens]|nr:hypothetical protein JL721_11709 [Aureococcus anophagefferens]
MFFRKKRPDARKAADPETAPPAAADPETDPRRRPGGAYRRPPEGSPTSPRRRPARRAGAAARVPEQYVCRISNEVMRDPVVLADGYSYERRAAEAWLAARDTSPATNRPLDHTLSCPNRDLADLIRGDPRRRGRRGLRRLSAGAAAAARVETGVVDWFGDQCGFVRQRRRRRPLRAPREPRRRRPRVRAPRDARRATLLPADARRPPR